MEEHVDEDQMYVEFDGDDIPEFKESNGTRLFRFGVMRATKDELIMENIFDASTNIDVCSWIMPRENIKACIIYYVPVIHRYRVQFHCCKTITQPLIELHTSDAYFYLPEWHGEMARDMKAFFKEWIVDEYFIDSDRDV